MSTNTTLGWAWVAGASEGLGLAFAAALAQRGYSLLLFARRDTLLREVGRDLSAAHSVRVETRVLDMAGANLATALAELLDDHPPSIGVYNAAYVPVGEFLERSHVELEQAIAVNARAPLLFCHTLGRAMMANRCGALVLMSSLAGMQGSPRLAAYSATKAFNTILGEALWAELRAHNINVITSVAGAIETPGYANTAQTTAPGTLSAEAVAQRTLSALDKRNRGPVIVPGWVNRIAYLLVGRWLPRRHAVAVMARNTESLNATTASATHTPREGA